MKAYKVTMLFVDHDEVGRRGTDAIVQLLEDARLPNHIIGPDVMSIEEADIGEWHDGHPLNYRDKQRAEFERLFGGK